MKVLVLITEDWFVLSHFVPLLAELRSLAGEVVVATRSSGRLQEIERLGVRVRPFDMQRGTLSIPTLIGVRSGLANLIDDERADVLHAVSMQSIVIASVSLRKARHRPSAIVLHLTGLGYLGQSSSLVARGLSALAIQAIRRATSKFNAWLLAENRDDLARLVAAGAIVPERAAVIPGCGIDPAFPAFMELPSNAVPRAAFVGRMLLSKGVGTLVEAHRRVLARGGKLDLALYGAADPGSRQAVPHSTLSTWNGEAGVTWHGRTSDIVGVWRQADMAVTPSLGGEGMPRAMLEAAACGRPLVVSDVAGCREFVRNGVEGFVVPPGDAEALAQALERLASDPALRARMGAAARRRVEQDYSERAVRARIRKVYQDALDAARV